MISVRTEGGRREIAASVTDFASALGYCELQVPLMVEGVRVPAPRAAAAGAAAHREQEAAERERGELVEVTEDDIREPSRDVEFARESVFTRLEIPVRVGLTESAVVLSGRTDKLMRQGGTLAVQDDKFVGNPAGYAGMRRPYGNQMLQVLAYLNSAYSETQRGGADRWWDVPHEKKMWIVRICDRRSGEAVREFSGVQGRGDLAYLHRSVERFAVLALGAAEPEHHNKAAKCGACRYNSVCDSAL